MHERRTIHKLHGFPPSHEMTRHERSAMGCALILAAGWSVLLAGLILAATRWLLTH